MKIKKARLFAVLLGGAAYAANLPDALRYETSCALVDSNSADGYVTNRSQVDYQVTGQVRFSFPAENSMSRPEIVYAANSMVPAGQTVRVARVKLAFQPLPGETCVFVVKDVVRKAA